MIIIILYWLISPAIWILIPFISLINPKIRHHWLNQKQSINKAKKKILNLNSTKQVVLFHASSAGEFEQITPILEKIDRSKFFILISVYSPTIYRIEKESSLGDAVCYHPFDFLWSAWYFFTKMTIKYYIITRNDLWPSHLFVAKALKINTILINANLYNKKHFTSFLYKIYYKYIFNSFNLIMTSSERLKNNLLHLVPNKKIIITGDSRLDRVIDRKKINTKTLLPDTFISSKTIILGSIIKSDYPYIFKGLQKKYPNGYNSIKEKNHRLIIVPHEVNPTILSELELELNKINLNYIFLSNFNKLENSRVVIIDKIGILADLYKYSNISYIGAGFDLGVHSVIEPAIYNNAISFGPNFHILDMAVSLIDNNLASIIKSSDDFSEFCSLLDNKEKLAKIKYQLNKFINDKSNASTKIVNEIF